MDEFNKKYEVIWADMDPNRHMRHSVYNDYAAQTRVAMFSAYGLSIQDIASMGLGPILFREEVRFLKEIQLSEIITVGCTLKSMRKDGSKWIILHELFKENKNKAAEITVDGAWLNLHKRKVEIPPTPLREVMHKFPRTEDFEWMPDKV